MGSVAAAAVIHKEKEIVTAFRKAGATAPATAKPVESLGIHEGVAYRRLRKRAVLREAKNGALYLDEPSWEALEGLRRRIAFLILGIALLAGAVAMVLSRAGN